MSDESRYQRTKRIEHEKARHARIVSTLTQPIEEEWDQAREKFRPKCKGDEIPTRWTDWDSDPDRREFYEGDRPSAEEANALCAGCPILADRLCERYAEQTGQAHGVWGGRRREDGKWVKDNE